jgi:hypothetical protein
MTKTLFKNTAEFMEAQHSTDKILTHRPIDVLIQGCVTTVEDEKINKCKNNAYNA